MKKVITLILALVMVLGVSAVTMAAEGNLNDADVNSDIGINLTVEPYAKLITPDTIDFTEENALNTGPGEYTVTGSFNVQTNTSVTLSSNVTGFENASSALSVTSAIANASVAAGSNVARDITLTANWAGNDTDAWESLTAGDYAGTVTVTVSADQ